MRRFRYCFLLLTVVYPLWLATPARASCSSPANAIEAENCLPGTAQTTWDISGAGDSTIQGFTTDISVNVGQTVSFKINTNATNYKTGHLSPGLLRRKGRSSGDDRHAFGAPSPDSAGMHHGLGYRSDGLRELGGLSHLDRPLPLPPQAYISRCSHARIPAATATFLSSCGMTPARPPFFSRRRILHGRLTTTTAVRILYTGGPGPQNGAYKVSYNRPYHTRVYEFYSWIFNAEYPMIRFLEANGYDVTYFSSLDADRFGSQILAAQGALVGRTRRILVRKRTHQCRSRTSSGR